MGHESNTYLWAGGVVAVAVAVAAGLLLFLADAYVDDAFISLRYASNLLAGHGMVWEPGERVEGYTNFLYIIAVAGLGWLGVDLVAASNVLNIASYLGLVGLAAWHMRSWRRTHPDETDLLRSAVCLGFIVASLPIVNAALSGMETLPLAFLVTLGAVLVLRAMDRNSLAPAAAAGLVFALAAMMRADAVTYPGFTGCFLAASCLLDPARRRTRFLQAAGLTAAFALIYLPYTGWRVAYFGDWMPNTYWAKVHGIDSLMLFMTGSFYLFQFLSGPPFLMLLALSWLAFERASWRIPAVRYLAGLALAHSAYVSMIGGDWMPHARLLAPTIPFWALVIFHARPAPADNNRRVATGLCAAFVLLALSQFSGMGSSQSFTRARTKAVADYISRHWEKDALVALTVAGELPYLAPQFRYLDMLGLLDKTIGHKQITGMRAVGQRLPGHYKGDGAYVLSRRPDYIIFANSWGAEKPFFLSELELTESVEFRNHYEKVTVILELPEPERRPGLALPDDANWTLDEQGRLRFIFFKHRKSNR